MEENSEDSFGVRSQITNDLGRDRDPNHPGFERIARAAARHDFPLNIWDALARIFDAWGFDRCLWGTDRTRASAVVSFEQAPRPFLETNRLSESERAMLMGGACAKAYRWGLRGGRRVEQGH